jgi:putative ABC transport system permease protein
VDDEFEQLHSDISGNTEIDEYLFAAQKSITVEASGKNIEAYAVVPEESDKIGSFISLRDRKTHSSFTLSDDGVIINEKLAKLLDVQVGDNISFENSDASAEILAITENYSGNYIYFTQNLYENVFGECKFNIFYFNKKSGTDNDSLSKSILTNSSVMSVNFMEFSGDTFRKLVKSLNSIVYVIIGSSGALAVVVLYNLSNININERMRELATIKVLGFYDSETAAYIYRENVVSSVIGMLLGLFGGVFLTRFVVQTAEVDVVMFCPDIPLHCYIYAAGLTIVFTTLVNGLLHFKIKKIDMASSMKAIE